MIAIATATNGGALSPGPRGHTDFFVSGCIDSLYRCRRRSSVRSSPLAVLLGSKSVVGLCALKYCRFVLVELMGKQIKPACFAGVEPAAFSSALFNWFRQRVVWTETIQNIQWRTPLKFHSHRQTCSMWVNVGACTKLDSTWRLKY